MPAHTDHGSPLATPSMVAAMQTWRTAHPQATFAEIEVAAMHQVAALQTELIAVALDTDPAVAPPCPDCGRSMVRNGTRTITTSHAERVTLTGDRYRCSVCGTELPPPR